MTEQRSEATSTSLEDGIIDPIRYEIFFNKLDQALNEAQGVIRYLSGSNIVREAGEALEALYLPSGEAVDIACGILMHFMNVTRLIHYMQENQYEAEGIGIFDGDHFVNNDAYIGGMHCPDIGLIAPFFYKGELLGYLAAISHTTETGGVEPGGMCPSAREAWHDGFHAPGVKMVERGQMRRDVWGMLLRSTRDPRTFELDMRARIAGNERARQRLTELVDEFGVDFFKAASRRLVDDGEQFFKAKLKRLRPGIYSARMYTDTLGGIQPPKLCITQIDLEIRADGTMSLQVPVVSPQQPCFNNAYLPAVEASLVYCLLTQVVFDGRWNSGLARAIDISVPPHSRLNADPDQSVGYATIGIAFSVASSVTEALSRAYYASGIEEEVQAPAGGSINDTVNAGIDRYERPFANILLSNGLTLSGGARAHEDGVVNYHFYNPWQMVPDAEAEEVLTATLHLHLGTNPDAAGFGKWRGGATNAAISMIHHSPAAFPSSKGSGAKISSNQGIFGGYPGIVTYVDHLLDTDIYEIAREGKPLPNEVSDIVDVRRKVNGKYTRWGASAPSVQMKSGDLWVQLAASGGGLGDPLEREPERIVEDVSNRVTSIDAARRVYCVAIDPSTLEIDREETSRLRAARVRERLSKGLSGREYIRNLVEKRRNRNLTVPVLELLDETAGFSEAFRQQLAREEALAAKDLKPLGKVAVKKELFKLTPYVNVVENDEGKAITVCSKCGFAYGPAEEDHKLYALIYDRDPADNLPPHLAPDKDWAIYREFYCPNCAVQFEVDQCPPGMPIIPNAQIDLDCIG